jgi:anti-sigma factor RsiW
MTDRHHSIREIDLLAYVDGLFDAYPERKAEVEGYLREHPEEATRVRDYADQNDKIRRLYGPVLAEPVPERLKAVLENRPGMIVGHFARATIVASLLLAAGFMGWMIGKSGQPDPWPVQDFVEQAMTTYLRPHLASDASTKRALEKAHQPLHGLSQQSVLPFQPPDLSQQGFTLVDNHNHLRMAHDPQATQVTYADPSGRRFSLFLRTLWRKEAPQFHFTENEGVTMVYWLEGPLAYALVGQLDRQEMLAVVKAVRQSMPHINPNVVLRVPQIETEGTSIGDAPLVPYVSPSHINPIQQVTKTE